MKIAKHLQVIQPSYIREILSEATAEGVISLAGGLPAPEHFPIHLMKESLASLASKETLFQYGETAGYPPLLKWLKKNYQLGDEQGALVCTGSQQALDLIARTYMDKGDGVAMEEPAYLGALQVFGMSQSVVHTVPQTEDGPQLDKLEQLFASGKVKMFYAVPDFHNPSGVCWSLHTRKKVGALCQQYEVTLIEDAPYREIRFSGQALPMASSFCPQQSLVMRSFSKIATPGMRIGFVSGPKLWVDELTKVKQAADLHSSLPMQEVLLALLQHPEYPAHLQKLCDVYGERYKVLATELRAKLPECHFNEVDGGMFIWLTLPSDKGDAMDIARNCIKNGVAVVPGCVFYPEQGKNVKELTIRLNFSHAKPDELKEAIQRLVSVIG